MQEARKWLFRPNFFSSSKWAQFLHVTLDLIGKRCPIIFSAVLFFVFEKFSSTSTGSKCTLRWFYCLEKQKLSLERTPPGKKLRFCIHYLWNMKEKPANLNRGVCFSMKWKATCQNWAQLDEEKQFGLKSHLRASCMQPFNCFLESRVWWNALAKDLACFKAGKQLLWSLACWTNFFSFSPMGVALVFMKKKQKSLHVQCEPITRKQLPWRFICYLPRNIGCTQHS